MKATTEAIAIKLTRDEGNELLNQILKLTGGSMDLYAGDLKGTAIARLFELLSGNFTESHSGVHVTSA